jgi:hypothetical protein
MSQLKLLDRVHSVARLPHLRLRTEQRFTARNIQPLLKQQRRLTRGGVVVSHGVSVSGKRLSDAWLACGSGVGVKTGQQIADAKIGEDDEQEGDDGEVGGWPACPAA